MRFRGFIVLVVAALALGCTSNGRGRFDSYCGSKAACEDGPPGAIDSCVSIFEDEAMSADEAGCGAEFDAMFTCRVLNSYCEWAGSISAFTVRGCTEEFDAYLACR